MQLTKSNLHQFRRSVELENMPRTFTDTILVCRKLKIRYLWIDSLCIMQNKNDTSDWAREADLMYKVYSFCYLNIAAADAENSTHGLFRRGKAPPSVSQIVRIVQEDGNQVDVSQDYGLFDHTFWVTNVTHSTLNKRGWVMQERLLAPRVLHSTREQFFWECRCRMTWEDLSDNVELPSYMPNGCFKKDNNYGQYLHDAIEEVEGPIKKRCYYMWMSLVHNYSHATLSHPSDKLIAISGIASAFASILNDRYIAGMWHADLKSQLTWKCVGDCSRSAKYRAPTWSWASIDGPIQWLMGLNYGFDVADVKLENMTENVTGQIRYGHLDLRGFLFPLQLSTNSRGGFRSSAKVGGAVLDGLVIAPDSAAVDTNAVVASTLAGDVFIMPCSFDAVNVKYDGFILHCVDRLNGTFERLGVLFHIPPAKDGGCWNPSDEYSNTEKASWPCLSYEDGKHTIRII